jgi:pimeloyl-ACP methyl ester carboxylesterase
VDGLPAEVLRQRLRAAHPGWSPAALDATAANLRELPDGTVQRRLTVENHMRIVRSMWEESPRPDLERVTVPALVMVALGSSRGTVEEKRERVKRATAALPRGRVREYLDGDHDLHAQQPAAVAADLLALALEV